MNQPLTKDDFIYYDTESDSVYFGVASDSEIVQYEEHLFFADKVQSAVEGLKEELREHFGDDLVLVEWEDKILPILDKWFPVFTESLSQLSPPQSHEKINDGRLINTKRGAATVFGGTSVPPTHERNTLVESVAAETLCIEECNANDELDCNVNCGCVCHKEEKE